MIASLVAKRSRRELGHTLKVMLGIAVIGGMLIVLVPAIRTSWHYGVDNACQSSGSFMFQVDQSASGLDQALTEAYREHGLHYSGDITPLENATTRLNGMPAGDKSVGYLQGLTIPICSGP